MTSMPTGRSMLGRHRGALTTLLAVGIAVIAVGWLRTGGVDVATDATYREAVVGTPTRINPLTEPANQAEADLVRLIFSGLMRLRRDGLPEPELAERWEVTPDALTYTFHLQPDATWHDGAAFTAHDVAFTIGRLQAEDFAGPETLRAAWIDVQVFVADAQTVLMRLPEPSADFLARATLGMLPEHRAGEMSADAGFAVAPFDRAPVGTGPYRLTAIRDDRAVLRHNTSYILGTPAIGEIEVRFAASDAERLQWLTDGEVDGALFDETISPVSIRVSEALTTTPLNAGVLTVLYFNNLRAPLSEVATRRALTASIDVAAALATANATEVPATGVFPPGSWAYPEPEEAEASATASDGPDAAELFWAVGGWTRDATGQLQRDGEPLVLELVTNGEPQRVALAEAIVGQLGAVGVGVELVTAPAQRVVTDYLRPGAYSLALFGWQIGHDPDPYGGWHTSQIGAGNVAIFSDPESDALLEVARTTLDTGERRELYALFAARFDDTAPSLIVSHPVYHYVHSAALRGIASDRLLTRPEQRFADVHRWQID
ncbi:MAG: hypothetical protein DWG80_05385 [Chloroflexi bacterium]|nr:hypothetical protein [Chloroflexota bacterium]